MDNDIDLMRFVIAFLVVLSLMFILAWAAKRAGLVTMPGRLTKQRRLKVIEHMPLDHRRRAILLRRDNVEHLVVLSPDGACVVETGIPVSAETLRAEDDAEKQTISQTV